MHISLITPAASITINTCSASSLPLMYAGNFPAGFEQEQPAQQQASAKLRNGKKQAATPGKRKSSALSNGCAQPRPVVVTAPGSLVAAVGWTGGQRPGSPQPCRLRADTFLRDDPQKLDAWGQAHALRSILH